MSGIYKTKLDTCKQSREQIVAKIQRIDQNLDNLYTASENLALNGDVEEVEIDTGQSKQKVKYRDPESLAKTISRYENIRDNLRSRLSSSVTQLMDAKNFNGR